MLFLSNYPFFDVLSHSLCQSLVGDSKIGKRSRSKKVNNVKSPDYILTMAVSMSTIYMNQVKELAGDEKLSRYLE